jgi:histidine triad (HIT) family protein
MSSIFSKILKGEVPSFKIAENEHFFAFLDVFPLIRGHVLVIPKVEVDKFFDVDDLYLKEWLIFAKPIAKAIEQAFPCNRCGMTVIGLEVPHAHMHLMPISRVSDMNFQKPKLDLSEEELKSIQEKILAALKTH